MQSFVGVKWFCAGHGNVGIVKVICYDFSHKYYVGHVDGVSEAEDIKKIMDWGSSFPSDAGDVLFK